MPRQSRIDAPGALHHIIVRGIERRKIFIDDQDRHDFIDRLGNILEQTEIGKQTGPARRGYRAFVAKGIDQGRRWDLTGGGLIRSTGGWAAVKALKKNQVHVKSDERILGDGDFVEKSLFKCQEAFERQYTLKARGVDLDYVVDRVARIFEMKSEHLWMPGKSRQQVTSRSLLCFWAVRELGESMASLAKRLNISTAAVSKSVARGAEIADREGHELI